MVVDKIKQILSSLASTNSNSSFLPFILSLLLIAFDVAFGFDGLKTSDLLSKLILTPFFFKFVWSILILAIAIAAFILLTKIGSFDRTDALLVSLYSFFTIFIMLVAGRGGVMHVILLSLVIFSLEPPKWELRHKLITIMILYLLDFFLVGFFNNALQIVNGSLRYIFPFHLLIVFVFGRTYESSSILKFLYGLGIFIFIFSMAFHIYDVNYRFDLSQTMSQEEIAQGVAHFYTVAWENAKSFGTDLRKAIMSPFNTSSYDYSGKQEETKNPQGVYLNEIEKGDMLFFEEIPALLWAVLEARTLEKAIDKVSVKCELELEDGTIMQGIVNEGTTTYTFPVYTGVDRPLSCRFDGLIEGNYNAKFLAEFDFTTESRQLVYLMDRTRYTEEIIALRRQGKSAKPNDVLNSVDITETNPESIYTSGPVAVKIATNSFPWDIGDTNNILYLLGVEITNEWTRGGEIKSINKVRFVIPSTFSIVDNSCGVKIKLVSLGANANTGAGEKIYETIEEITDVEDERKINCLMRLDKSSLDKSVEVTRRYLKAEVDYTYIMEQKTDFEVEKLHDELDTKLLENDQVCCLMDTNVYEKKPKTECTKVAPVSKCYEECCKLSTSGSNDQYKWVDSAAMCDKFDSQYTSASLVEDKTKCPRK